LSFKPTQIEVHTKETSEPDGLNTQAAKTFPILDFRFINSQLSFNIDASLKSSIELNPSPPPLQGLQTISMVQKLL